MTCLLGSRRAAIAGLVAAAGMVEVSSAQHSYLIHEVSRDQGLTWHAGVTVPPGSTVFVQVRVHYFANATVLGLAGFTFQPTLSQWNVPGGDTRLPFVGTIRPGHGSPDVLGNTGRLIPFDATDQSSSSLSGELTSFVDNGNVLRFAGNRASPATTNLAWGVSIAQHSQMLSGTSFSSSTSPTVFRYAVQLGSSTSPRTLVATSPHSLVYYQRLIWYLNPLGSLSLRYTLANLDIIPAYITVSIDAPDPDDPDPTGETDHPQWLRPGARYCVADVDDGSTSGTRDGGVTIDDLLYYLDGYAQGLARADIDDGSGTNTPDGGVTIDDLLFFLTRYDAGC